MTMKKISMWLLCVFLLSQCHKKMYSLENLPKEFIEMGSYGGFAGTATKYFFFPNGQRFLSNGIAGGSQNATSNEIEKAQPKDFKNMLKGLKALNFCDLELNEVGNMTYFIKLKNKKEEKLVQWNNMDTAPAALVSFFREQLQSIPKAPIN